jgi:thiamine phosphate synthase YjbQ (UPF0047 family)
MPRERCFEIVPPARHALVDLRRLVQGDLRGHRFTLWWSAHTTAGFLDDDTLQALGSSGRPVRDFLDGYRTWFPPDAGYHHDDLARRTDLSPRQRLTEPRNADSHLTFIAAGLQTCVAYETRCDTPWYLVELDGEGPGGVRRRTVRAMAFDRARVVTQHTLHVPVPGSRPATVSLGGPGSTLCGWIDEELRRHSIRSGYVRLEVRGSVEDAALTVNEYEPLLMRCDLPAAARAEGMRLQRSIQLLVSDADTPGQGRLLQGTYQSPILIARTGTQAVPCVVDVSIHELL